MSFAKENAVRIELKLTNLRVRISIVKRAVFPLHIVLNKLKSKNRCLELMF